MKGVPFTSAKPGAVPINTLRGSFEHCEYRREERFLAERPVRIIHRGQPFDAWLVDCSAHGLQVVTRKAIDCNETFGIEFHASGTTRTVEYLVRYWFQLWADACQIGAEAAGKIPDAEAAILLKELLAGAKQA